MPIPPILPQNAPKLVTRPTLSVGVTSVMVVYTAVKLALTLAT